MKSWLIDCWNTENTVNLWIHTENGENEFLHDIYYPKIYVSIVGMRGQRLLNYLSESEILIVSYPDLRIDVWSGKKISVFLCRVLDVILFAKFLRKASMSENHITFFDTEIPLVQGYMFDKGIYPMSEIDYFAEDGKVTHIRSLQNDVEFPAVPTLKRVYIRSRLGKLSPVSSENPIFIGTDRSKMSELPSQPVELLRAINYNLDLWDPDIIYSSFGDEFLFPTLFEMSYRYGIKLRLDRGPIYYRRNNQVKGRSISSYGRVLFKTTPFPLFGRLHIDQGLSFFYNESELNGILEICKYSRMNIQKLARSSPGTAMAWMEDEVALKNKILIPRVKGKAPKIKPIYILIKTDNGGLSFRPPVGVFEHSAELDFRSLYPSLMRLHNISGETVNCSCCKDGSGKEVPFIPYHTCTKRKGIVPETISTLLDRRDVIKEMLANEKLEKWQRKNLEFRSSAIKWCLVTSFGYTGYKNAKYGQREAHEAITAWGRESLLTAKDTAEDMGFEILHAMTDSIWIYNNGRKITEEEIKKLCLEINQRTGLRIFQEAVYSWIYFPPSKTKEFVSVPTRYIAREADTGKMKIRGIMTRKRDTPKIISNFQHSLLEILATCESILAVNDSFDLMSELYRSFRDQINSGKLDENLLAIKRVISRTAETYKQDNASKIILEILQEDGISLQGGQTISYIAVNTSSSRKQERYVPTHLYQGNYDRSYYIRLLRSAFAELVPGYALTKSEEWKLDQGSLF